MNLKVCGHRVLIDPNYKSDTTDAGIYVGHSDTFQREKGAVQIGIIVDIGPNAWLDFKPGDPWAEVGDKVYFAKYAGKEVEAGNEKKYIIVNDEDVQCKIIEDEENA